MHVPQGRQALRLGIVQRNGWTNLYLYDLSGKLITPLTTHTTFEVGNVVKIDEAAGVVFYTARDGDNFLKLQLHRVGLDGKGEVRLTDPAFHHTVEQLHAAGAAAGPHGGRRRRRLRHFTRQQVFHRRLPDARHAAGHAHRRCDDGTVGRRAGQERSDEVRRSSA